MHKFNKPLSLGTRYVLFKIVLRTRRHNRLLIGSSGSHILYVCPFTWSSKLIFVTHCIYMCTKKEHINYSLNHVKEFVCCFDLHKSKNIRWFNNDSLVELRASYEPRDAAPGFRSIFLPQCIPRDHFLPFAKKLFLLYRSAWCTIKRSLLLSIKYFQLRAFQ